MSKAQQLSDQTFKAEISKGLTLVDFWAPWCGPCRMVAPIIDELTEEYRGRVKVAQINVDDNPNTAMEYRVMSIPTIILFRDGQPVETLVGAQPKRNFVARIEQHVGQGASA